MSIIFSKITSVFDVFLADEDKVGEQVRATMTTNGKKCFGLGGNEEEALESLRDNVNNHYNAQRHVANLEINKANGEYFFD